VAPLGNKNAVGNKGGRPTLYDAAYHNPRAYLSIDGRDYKIISRLRILRPNFTSTEFSFILGISEDLFNQLLVEDPKLRIALCPTPDQIDQLHQKLIRSKQIKSQISKTYHKKRRIDPAQRVLDSTRSRMSAALKGQTDGKLFERLRYTLGELVSHLESKFSEGMNWSNYGQWHIDHIRPCSSFDLSDPAIFLECWALDNLQPLWKSDNLRKGVKYAST
jgi:hypothetical protein